MPINIRSGFHSSNNDEILVREIIDIDTNYMDDDENSENSKDKKKDEDDTMSYFANLVNDD